MIVLCRIPQAPVFSQSLSHVRELSCQNQSIKPT